MGVLQNLIQRWKEKNEEKGDYERQLHIRDEVEAKRMNSNERELRRFIEQDRKKKVKAQLDWFRKRENDEVWRGKKGNPIFTQNITNGENIIKDDKHLFDGRGFLNNGNMFFKK